MKSVIASSALFAIVFAAEIPDQYGASSTTTSSTSEVLANPYSYQSAPPVYNPPAVYSSSTSTSSTSTSSSVEVSPVLPPSYTTSTSAPLPPAYSTSSTSSSASVSTTSSTSTSSTAASATIPTTSCTSSLTTSTSAPGSPVQPSGTAPVGPVYTTQVVTALTTVCPSATLLTYGQSTYTISSSTTLTITNCPCTVSSLVSKPTGPASSGAPPFPSVSSSGFKSSYGPGFAPTTTSATATAAPTGPAKQFPGAGSRNGIAEGAIFLAAVGFLAL